MRADSRLRTCAPEERPAYLQLASRCARAPGLADAIITSGLPLAWTTEWAAWRLQPPHHTFTGHTGWVRAVALGQIEGRTVVVSGSDDQTVRIWDVTAT
jgi:WD40 repeat protein